MNTITNKKLNIIADKNIDNYKKTKKPNNKARKLDINRINS